MTEEVGAIGKSCGNKGQLHKAMDLNNNSNKILELQMALNQITTTFRPLNALIQTECICR